VIMGGIGGASVGTCEYNQIVDNTFSENLCTPQNCVYLIGGSSTKYNLIQGNTFQHASHVVIELQGSSGTVEKNIIKNNVVQNKWHGGINVYGDASWNLVTGNTIYDCGSDHSNNSCGTENDRNKADMLHGAIIVEGTHNIIRKNVAYNNGCIAVENYSDTCDDNRIYSNTCYDNYADWYTNTVEQVHNNQYKNNISSQAVTWGVYHNAGHANRSNYFSNNCFYSPASAVYWYPSGAKTVAWMETNYSSLWGNNTTSDPTFTNAAGKDFTLLTGSPCIDTGAWLTLTNGTGSASTTLIVDDASYFCDGWNIITGDTIQIDGDATTAVITSINYGTDTITIDTALTWGDGVGVALAYNGTDPDMGAHEYDGGDPPVPEHKTVLKSGTKLILGSGLKVVIK